VNIEVIEETFDNIGSPPQNAIAPFRTRLGEVDTAPYTLQRIAGHSSILISSRYVYPTPERLEDAFETYNQAKVTSTA
jgi:hypothetical protein